jgi:hypothetical protein
MDKKQIFPSTFIPFKQCLIILLFPTSIVMMLHSETKRTRVPDEPELNGLVWLRNMGYLVDKTVPAMIVHLDHNKFNDSTIDITSFNLTESGFTYIHPVYSIALKRDYERLGESIISSVSIFEDSDGEMKYFLPDQLLLFIDRTMYPTPQHFLQICKCEPVYVSRFGTFMTVWAKNIFQTSLELQRFIGVKVEPVMVRFNILAASSKNVNMDDRNLDLPDDSFHRTTNSHCLTQAERDVLLNRRSRIRDALVQWFDPNTVATLSDQTEKRWGVYCPGE